jgi:predicted component of type VI protein secretion system
VAALNALGALAAELGAPFVAAAHPSLLGVSSFADPDPVTWAPPARWQALREGAGARWLGLAAPRWLVRLPYGTRTDPIESFPFEEQPSDHEQLLWGSPAFACAILVAAGADELDDLPCYTFRAMARRTFCPSPRRG